MRFGDRKLHTLVLSDWTAKNHAITSIRTGFFDKPATIADTFGGDQCALGIKAVEDISEPFTLFTDQAVGRQFKVVEEQLVGFVIDHVGDRLNG
ncbi:hypothetical protein D3C71_524950 [compost metagenome]